MENVFHSPYELHELHATISDNFVNRQKAGPDNGKR